MKSSELCFESNHISVDASVPGHIDCSLDFAFGAGKDTSKRSTLTS